MEKRVARVLRFRSTIKIRGVNPYVLVDARRAATLKGSWRKPMPVRNAKPEMPWRINMMPCGDGGFFLYLAQIVRDASGTQVGDPVRVELEFDDKYRSGPVHQMPTALRDGLDQDAIARRTWKRLIPSRRKEILRYLAALKSDESRARNVTRALRVLGGAKERFMARDWNGDSPARRAPRRKTRA